ncbi:class I adenylate-forming enzyme family protein [Longispora albida]|uniref:class I adenylate-forming enzyme family protein n=1 Tax=Longispora albida TaxID=203523 RepID=UPI00036A7FEE|nr:class I adenylate-forming enzyme family protein [Longispora albida]
MSIRATLAADPALGAGNALRRLLANGVDPAAPVIAFDTDVDAHPAWERWSLGDLDRAVAARAAWLHSRGVGPREVVAVFEDTAAGNILAFLAIARLGAIAALVNARLDVKVAARYIRRLRAGGVLTSREDLIRADPEARWLGPLLAGEPDEAPEPYEHHDDDPVAITHSSGTTGIPKAVTGTHHSLFAAIRYRLTAPRAQGLDRWLSALPAAHNSTLTILNLALCNRTELLALSSQSAESTLEGARRWQPGTVLGFSVTWAELAARDLSGLDSVSVWWNTGDSAHESHIRKLIGAGRHRVPTKDGPQWRDGSVFVDNLGSSELGHSVFSITHRPDTERYGRCVGKPDAYAEAKVIDEGGRELPAGQPGLLAVRTPSMSPGYWNDSVATYASRRKGWLLTGDVVRRDEAGFFYHLDRATDTYGGVYTVLAEEQILTAVPGVLDCTVVASPDGTDIYLQAAGPVDEQAIRAAIGAEAAATIRKITVDGVPQGATGKVRKVALR